MLFKEQTSKPKNEALMITVIFLVFLALFFLFDFQKEESNDTTKLFIRTAMVVEDNGRRREKKIYDLELKYNSISSNKHDLFPIDSKTTMILTS